MRHSNTAAVVHQRGVSLVELMVALVLGLFLIFGAVTIYNQSQRTYRTTEATARLQEAARYAMHVIESDVRMANYWGMSNRADYIVNRAVPLTALDPDLAGASAAISACGSNWAVNLDQYLQGSNGQTAGAFALDCDPFRDDWRNGTDVLVVRRGSEEAPDNLIPGRLYLQTSRIQGVIFLYDEKTCGAEGNPKDPACIPPEYSPPASETRELIATAYYISNQSTGRPDVPSLRRKRLAAGTLLDEEVIPGVEDLQVVFGIDTNGDTSADTYVNPASDPATYGGEIVSATIWLRVRAEQMEVGFTDDRTYVYADVNESPADPQYRRFAISKTIQLRNKRL